MKLDIPYISNLVVEAKKGDSDACAELFAATYQVQYKIIRTFFDESESKSLLRKIYVEAFHSIYQIPDPGIFLSWITQITLRSCFDKKNYNSIEINDKKLSIMQILHLPFAQCQSFSLYYLCKFSLKEIADMLDIQKKKVTDNITAACQTLEMRGEF